MKYLSQYKSPLGNIVLTANEDSLTGLWFEENSFYKKPLDNNFIEKDLPIFDETKKWLDIYFSGRNPDFTPALDLSGTKFQVEVWNLLRTINYGETTTYGKIAKQISEAKNIPGMSAQAVGQAIRHNKILIIIPCHRVVGTNGKLTGYTGRLDRKFKLLESEQASHKFNIQIH